MVYFFILVIVQCIRRDMYSHVLGYRSPLLGQIMQHIVSMYAPQQHAHPAAAKYLYKYNTPLLVYSEPFLAPLVILGVLVFPPTRLSYNTVLDPPRHLPSNSRVGVRRVAVLALPDLPPLLADDVLNPHLVAVLLLEAPDKTRVPELRRNAEVLAAAHQGVRLAPLTGCRDRVFGEIAALAARLADKSTGLC